MEYGDVTVRCGIMPKPEIIARPNVFASIVTGKFRRISRERNTNKDERTVGSNSSGGKNTVV